MPLVFFPSFVPLSYSCSPLFLSFSFSHSLSHTLSLFLFVLSFSLFRALHLWVLSTVITHSALQRLSMAAAFTTSFSELSFPGTATEDIFLDLLILLLISLRLQEAPVLCYVGVFFFVLVCIIYLLGFVVCTHHIIHYLSICLSIDLFSSFSSFESHAIFFKFFFSLFFVCACSGGRDWT